MIRSVAGSLDCHVEACNVPQGCHRGWHAADGAVRGAAQVKATAEKMGRAARSHVLRNFTRGAFGQRLEEIVRDMVG